MLEEERGGGLDQHHIYHSFGREKTNAGKRQLSATVASCPTMRGLDFKRHAWLVELGAYSELFPNQERETSFLRERRGEGGVGKENGGVKREGWSLGYRMASIVL